MIEFVEAKTTICANCIHMLNVRANPAAPDVWYNFYCKASTLPETVDPVTGKKGFLASNDLGRKIIVDTPYLYCRDVNDYNCHLYEEKE